MRRELILNFHGLGMPHSGVGADEEPFWLSRRTFVAMIDRIAFMGEDAGAPTSITFDDGNASDATIALPELVKRGLTATFFVCADRIGLPHYLDRSAIDDLLQAGMAIGSHGMRHRDWRKLDDGALDEEISGARARLADVCGKPVQMASIPFGSYDRRVLARLRRRTGALRRLAQAAPEPGRALFRTGPRASRRRLPDSVAAAPCGDVLQSLALA
jgi:peptidoglycan/xylan/chitin deacetylase (PgdA/CDA1 family)